MKKGRVFNGKLAAHLERVRDSVGDSAYHLYLGALLFADDKGRIARKDLDHVHDLLERGDVGYDVLDDGAVRVWYHDR